MAIGTGRLRFGVWLGSLVIGGIVLALMIWSTLASPMLPFRLVNSNVVSNVGFGKTTLQPGDVVQGLDGVPFACLTVGTDGALTKAAADGEMVVEALDAQTGLPKQASVSSLGVDMAMLITRLITVVVGLTFFGAGIRLASDQGGQSGRWLVGLFLILTSIVIVGGPYAGRFLGALTGVYLICVICWGLTATLALARWPTNVSHLPGYRVALWSYGVITAGLVLLSVPGLPVFGCWASRPAFDLWRWLYTLLFAHVLVATLALLAQGMWLAQANHQRAQAQAVIGGIALGLGSPLLFGVIPDWLAIPWGVPVEMIMLVAVIMPVAFLVANEGQGSVSGIDQFMRGTLFSFVLLLVWLVLVYAGLSILSLAVPNPTPFQIILVAAAPIVVFYVLLRQPYGRFVELVLYGRQYEWEHVLAGYMRKAQEMPSAEQFVAEFVTTLPNELMVERAALWLRREVGRMWIRDADGQIVVLERPRFRLAASCGIDTALLDERLDLRDEWLEREQDGVVVSESSDVLVGGVGWDMVVLLRGFGDIEGILLIGPKVSRRLMYSAKDFSVLAALGAWMGIHLATWRMREERQAREREQTLELTRQEHRLRREVAQDLHDQVLPVLAFMRACLDVEDYEEIDRQVGNASDLIRQVMEMHLTPPGLELGLEQALNLLEERYLNIGEPIDTRFGRVDEAEHIMRGTYGTELYHIIAEAIRNAKKHSTKDTPVEVVIQMGQGGLEVFIMDQGPGFDVDAVMSFVRHGRGLGNMRARAERLGGVFDVRSIMGLGTVIGVTIPRRVLKREIGDELADMM